MPKNIDYDETVKDIDGYIKLAVAAWVISKLRDMSVNGGSYRHLVYDKLGFGVDELDPLLKAGAMDVTNALFEAAKLSKKTRKKY